MKKSIDNYNVYGGQSFDRQTDRQTGKVRSRNITLDIYKGLLIILVVLRHVLQYSVSDEGGIITNFIWAVQMPGFMLVAGYFAARKVDNWSVAGKRILLSAQHYALPFFTWFILVDVLLLGKMDRNPLTGLGQLLTHVDGGLWFLWVVFVLSIIFTLANRELSSKSGKLIKAGAVFIGCFGILLLIGKMAGINFLGIKYILYYAVYYGFGWLVKWTEAWWKQWWPRVKNTAMFLCLAVFLAIVFNFDLYHTGDGIVSISMRAIAGFTGNAVLLTICEKYMEVLSKAKLNELGMYTLEIYATHVYVVKLMEMGDRFFTIAGFGTFVCSLILTAMITTVIIATFKAIPMADFIFYGKKIRSQ